jgi:hypothetical protein
MEYRFGEVKGGGWLAGRGNCSGMRVGNDLSSTWLGKNILARNFRGSLIFFIEKSNFDYLNAKTWEISEKNQGGPAKPEFRRN